MKFDCEIMYTCFAGRCCSLCCGWNFGRDPPWNGGIKTEPGSSGHDYLRIEFLALSIEKVTFTQKNEQQSIIGFSYL